MKHEINIKDINDPLLYMEIVPSRETRIYMERVMANYWIYQIRLDQPTPTLKQLSQDKWPVISRN
jgi:soluble lytic murein transglycosylase-like protein